jgi:serine/threonine protein kinase
VQNLIVIFSFYTHPIYEKRYTQGFDDMGQNFLVNELMPRGSLFDVLGNKNLALLPERKWSFLHDTAAGLDFLHSCKPPIIHQDVKSLNVLVSQDWTCKVSDFGIAKEIHTRRFTISALLRGSDDSEKEAEIAHGGTVQWMPPEAMQELPPPPTTKLDVFAFGVIMWEVATRNRPWKSVPPRDIARAVRSGQRLPIPRGVWSRDFENFVHLCWHQSPILRPEFRQCLKKLARVSVP